ncbi:leucyl aminopeptidase [Wenxinia marina]|uniref:Probable cytosol aminopeptidase n=1 Tax=Wenxinia marina DSM 24838 TaxID=1123501 RepID=A0A0D0NHR3_9RHOB|nr:leucyl aminopeptidase [Wenxinia marina]KIQ67890.1 Leucyl aminopeptidase [Wenxinia marina DSM 24838]GGL74300.1 putative cytosol aminopeptidase [Wenxinia marina]
MPVPALTVAAPDAAALAGREGRIALVLPPDGRPDALARRLDGLTKGAVKRLLASTKWDGMKDGDVAELAFPAGLAAEAVLVAKLSPKADADAARRAGANLAAKRGKGDLLIHLGRSKAGAEIALGALLRAYAYDAHRTKKSEETGAIELWTDAEPDLTAVRALAEGVHFTRDLVNAPANVLTTTEFADRLSALSDVGLKVEVLEEDRLAELGMGALLAVGQGSASPSKVVVMEWRGGAEGEAPLALCGKGVVFDTGGISLKPAAGMEDMTSDMGGAGTVAGVMRALALRKAKANVVGLVGLVENMPSGTATRPGDIVTSMKGDTIEVVNTDAEGRLVLADVLWYAQETYKPAALVDLATLTGAVVVALGNEMTGVFSNDDAFAGALFAAADAEGEGAWRLPMGPAYDKLIDTPLADMKNSGGRPAGSITAAQLLRRFVKDDVPWVHLDIAGTATAKSGRDLAPKGATGWGVLTLDRLVRDRFETG